MAQLINLGGVQPIDEGEALVVQHLANVLPSNYLLYPNLEIATVGRQPYEYDLIVVAPHAIYVVEIKRWLVQISGGDYIWHLSSGKEKANPLRLTNHKARVLKGRLVQYSASLQHVWVEACVVIADEKTQLQLTGAVAKHTFLYPEVAKFLQDPSLLFAGGRSLASDALLPYRNTVRDAIEQECRIRTHAPQQIDHYTVVETLERTDLTDEYLVQNNLLPNSPTIRLRLYAFTPYLSPIQRDNLLNRIKRDALALQSIGHHPNLLAINDFFTDDSGHFIEITPWSEEGTLRDFLERKQQLSYAEKISLLKGIACGLSAAHTKGVIHRDLRPENILLSSDLTPRLMNFEHARIEQAGQATIWQSPSPDRDRRYLAPELDQLNPEAYFASDLYALGAMIYELFSGKVPFANVSERIQIGGEAPSLTTLVPGLPNELADLAATLYQIDYSSRHYTADDVVRILDQLLHPSEAKTLPDQAQPVTTYPLYYAIGEEIGGNFKVLGQLGSGGFGQVYKVFHHITNRVYAMKVINGEYSLDQLKREYEILSKLNHPNIAIVYFADRIHPTQFYLLMELIEGVTLTAFTKPENLLPPEEAVHLIGQLLNALDYLHQPNEERMIELRRKAAEGDLTQEEYDEFQQSNIRYLHRDIKPGNLMLDKQGNLKLLDFNIAARLSSQIRHTLIGTPNYMAPDIQMLGWDESVDLFAVGIVLYEMITGHYPFSDYPKIDSDPENPLHYRPELSDDFALFLYKITQPARGERFRTAREMHAELLKVADYPLRPTNILPEEHINPEGTDQFGETGRVESVDIELETWEKDRPNYNPYVTRLLTLYSQARFSNAGTRGLDPIAKATYVPTWLDERLLPDILEGKHRLVIITGNAGDGKTAFIQQLEAEAVKQGSHIELLHGNNGKRFHLHRLDFETNYDGSQDEGDKGNDQVLNDFLAPFGGHNPFAQPDSAARIIAINEGRLRDFLHTYRDHYPYLHKAILDFLEAQGNLAQGLLIVNLNWRSVVAGNENSILSRQVKKLVDPKFWAPCQSCEFKDRCFILANVNRFYDTNGSEQIIERLRTLFEVVYLRRRLHITMRDTRSALSYILLRDHNCDDVAQLLQNNQSGLEYLKLFYYNAFAAADEPANEFVRSKGGAKERPEVADRLLRQLMQVDPALVANPDTDRAMYFTTSEQLTSSPLLGFDYHSYDRQLLSVVHNELQNEKSNQGYVDDVAFLKERLLFHAMLRRKSFFERRDSAWRAMLPYRYIQEFLELVGSSGQPANEQEMKSKIAFAISRATGMRQKSYAQNNVVLRASSTSKTSIKSFRLFPISQFSLQVPILGKLADYIEYTPDCLFFQHNDQSVYLTISLDLFELLYQISNGMVPSPADIQGYFLNLSIFKNALAHLPYREALLTEDDQEFYRIWADEKDVLHITKQTEEGQ